jgi:nitrogen fixation NifU-like protein
MKDQFELFVANLQDRIFKDAQQAYGEVGFQRWRNPLYRDRMANPDASAQVKGPCGDTMEIYLKFENNRVTDASFFTDGCGASTVCGSFAAELALGRTPDELAEISGDDILQHIGRFPDDDRHCAFLAAETLQQALHAYMVKPSSAENPGR